MTYTQATRTRASEHEYRLGRDRKAASDRIRGPVEVVRGVDGALDRLLITPQTIREHPDLRQSLMAYISPDGRLTRIDVVPDARMSSEAAMDEVVTLRRRLAEYLGESPWMPVAAGITGASAESADIRALTRRRCRRPMPAMYRRARA